MTLSGFDPDSPLCKICASELQDYEVEDGYCSECQNEHQETLNQFPAVKGH